MLSEYAESLESWKERCLQKISVIGVDPASIPAEKFSPKCLPPVEASDLLSYLVLETSFYTKKQFKAFKSLEAFNQMVSGFVTSVVGKVIAGFELLFDESNEKSLPFFPSGSVLEKTIMCTRTVAFILVMSFMSTS